MQYAWYAAAINICLRIHLLICLTTVANDILTFNKHAFSEGTMIIRRFFSLHTNTHKIAFRLKTECIRIHVTRDKSS